MQNQKETSRVIYECARCGHVWAYDYEVQRFFVGQRRAYRLHRLAEINGARTYVSDDHDARCQKCSSLRVKANEVVAVYHPQHICNVSCVTAKRAECECSCGGKNHGVAYLVQ
jgi:hypothetical protein